MTAGPRFYAVRKFRSGAVLGSRLMTEGEAADEVRAWREHIGPAAKVQSTPESRRAVKQDDQAALWRMLLENEPQVWVSTSSHRSCAKLMRLAEMEKLGHLAEHGSWGKPGSGVIATGSYFRIPARLAEQAGAITGVRVLAKEPPRLFKRWELDDGPKRGNWPVPA